MSKEVNVIESIDAQYPGRFRAPGFRDPGPGQGWDSEVDNDGPSQFLFDSEATLVGRALTIMTKISLPRFIAPF